MRFCKWSSAIVRPRLLAVLFVLVTSHAACAQPCAPQESTVFRVGVSWQIDDWDGDGNPNYVDGTADITLTNDNGATDYGHARWHRALIWDESSSDYIYCQTGKTNCDGVAYGYVDVQIDGGWEAVVVFNGVGAKTVGRDHNEQYWRNYYEGYTEVGHADYSQNCHGYALGVGNWPQDEATAGPLDLLLAPGTCYESCDLVAPDGTPLAEVAITPDYEHSIKITPAQCTFWVGEDQFFEDTIVATSEKFRESQVFTRNQPCPSGLDPLKAHRASGLDSFVPWRKLD